MPSLSQLSPLLIDLYMDLRLELDKLLGQAYHLGQLELYL
jgi:Zn-dependent alcohol dehydrogenase